MKLLTKQRHQVVAGSNPVRSTHDEKMKAQTKVDISKHSFVPKHIKLTEEEEQELLAHYNISKKQLPAILKSDPAIRELNPKIGDIIKIIRKSATSGEYTFYRGVVNG